MKHTELIDLINSAHTKIASAQWYVRRSPKTALRLAHEAAAKLEQLPTEIKEREAS